MSCRLFAVVVAFAATISAQEPVRVATWNVQSLGSNGSGQWNNAMDILARTDADVVAIQEIDNLGEAIAFAGFSSQAGYPHSAVSNTSGTLSGSLRNGVMSKYPIVFSTSHSAASLSGDPNANDITRDIFEAHVQVPNAADVIGVFSLHLKASSGSTNDFRRAIEWHRVKQAVADFQALHPGAAYFIVGDFNDDLGDSGFGNTFGNLPGGLPSSYDLGNDIMFPVTYDPFDDLVTCGLVIANATQEDTSSIDTTREASGRRLDYLTFAGATLIGDEVYNSSRDNGVDDLPFGNWLPKSGSALPAGISLAASDHYLVFADYTVPSIPMLENYPGTLEDLAMSIGVNGAALTGGPGNDIKSVDAGDVITVNYLSTGSTFAGALPILVVQTFTPGNPPVGQLPGLWVNTSGGVVLFNGGDQALGFQTPITPIVGNFHTYLLPSGLAGNSVMMQALAVSGVANNGFFAAASAQELRFF